MQDKNKLYAEYKHTEVKQEFIVSDPVFGKFLYEEIKNEEKRIMESLKKREKERKLNNQ